MTLKNNIFSYLYYHYANTSTSIGVMVLQDNFGSEPIFSAEEVLVSVALLLTRLGYDRVMSQ